MRSERVGAAGRRATACGIRSAYVLSVYYAVDTWGPGDMSVGGQVWAGLVCKWLGFLKNLDFSDISKSGSQRPPIASNTGTVNPMLQYTLY